MVNSKNDRVYVALTTTGGSWYVEAMGEPGESKEAVEAKAVEKIRSQHPDPARDIYTQTELKNLIVLSKSAAMRSFSKAMRWHQEGIEEGWL